MTTLTAREELLAAASDDWIHVVDISDTTGSPQGTSKKMKVSELRNLSVNRELEAVSLAADQNPVARGIANALKIEFGAAQGTGGDPTMIDAAGKMTFNTAGLRRISLFFQAGRTGSSGTSLIFIRLLVNGVQNGRSVGFKFSNADDLEYIEVTNWFNVPASTTLEVEIMRDLSGSDFGGLVETAPTAEGAGTWNTSPCAVARIESLE